MTAVPSYVAIPSRRAAIVVEQPAETLATASPAIAVVSHPWAEPSNLPIATHYARAIVILKDSAESLGATNPDVAVR
jgi:hypothetical protein